MTYLQFVALRLGKKTDYDNIYNYQCVDLIKQYLKDVYATESWIFGGKAATWYDTGSPFINDSTHRKKIPYVDWLQPHQWDIIFWWESSANLYGHVAILHEVINHTTISVLEQNALWWGTGIWKNAIRIHQYPIKNVIWWYRYRPTLSPTDQAIVTAALTANGKLWAISSDPILRQTLKNTNGLIRLLYQ